MVIYTAKEAGAVLDLAHSTIRQYCHRYGIGTKHGRDWLLEDKDLDIIRSHQREEGDDLGTDCEVLPSDEYET